MNIVYGGAFNPVTKAHKMIIKTLINKYNPKNFIMVPVGNVYNKEDLIDYRYRIDMLNLSLNDLNITISDVEVRSSKFIGTYKMLTKLKEEYDDLYFVMGADNLVNLKHWINYEKLLKEFKFIIINRASSDSSEFINENLNEFKDHFFVCNLDIDINSTNIRNNLLKYKDDIEENVYDYIITNNLYKGEK